MRLLVVGGYTANPLKSMTRYGSHVASLASQRGVEVSCTAPTASLFALRMKSALARKWAGYLDQFVLYPRDLREAMARCDVAHLADQGNGPFLKWMDPSRTLVTCHDLLAIRAMRGEIPYWQVSRTGRAYQNFIVRGLKLAQWMACVSPSSLEDAARILGISRDRLQLVPNSCFARYQPSPGPKEDVVYHIGGNQPYKNRLGAVAIFQELAQRGDWGKTRLLFMGAEPDEELKGAVAASPVKDRIEFRISPSDEEVERVAVSSRLLLFPSLDEGFGLPILEAQSGGTPSATTAKAPMDWVAGEGAVTVELDPPRAADAIEEGLGNRQVLIEKGYHNLERFTESQEGDLLMGLYRKAGGQG